MPKRNFYEITVKYLVERTAVHRVTEEQALLLGKEIAARSLGPYRMDGAGILLAVVGCIDHPSEDDLKEQTLLNNAVIGGAHGYNTILDCLETSGALLHSEYCDNVEDSFRVTVADMNGKIIEGAPK